MIDVDEAFDLLKDWAAANLKGTFEEATSETTSMMEDLSRYHKRRLRVRFEAWITKKRLGSPTELWKRKAAPSQQIGTPASTS